jgi:glutamate dehydrogenase (NADP+)
MLKRSNEGLKGKVCLVSGSGNVAQYSVEKAIQLGAKVVTMSDSSGFIHDPDGIDEEKLAYLMELKNVKRGRIREYAEKYGCEFHGGTPWAVKGDLAFPCATQNEISGEDAKTMVSNGIRVVAEGANMPTEPAGIEVFLNSRILYAPGKAANAGGVAVSGFERSQNQTFLPWSRAEVDQKLQEVMHRIHQQCVKHGEEGEFINYVRGANVAGFVKVADAMRALGVV